jgi:hypothetical protein
LTGVVMKLIVPPLGLNTICDVELRPPATFSTVPPAPPNRIPAGAEIRPVTVLVPLLLSRFVKNVLLGSPPTKVSASLTVMLLASSKRPRFAA